MADEVETLELIDSRRTAPAQQPSRSITLSQLPSVLSAYGGRLVRLRCEPRQLTDSIVADAARSGARVGFSPIGFDSRPTTSPARDQEPALLGYTVTHHEPILLDANPDPRISFRSGDYDQLPLELQSRSWSAIGLMLNGRQTFCYLPGARLHPTRDDPALGLISPARIRARIWFLQSCHSPFVWEDLGGGYETLPLAILRCGATAVIASTRVQWPLPQLVEEFLIHCTSGECAADITIRLNESATRTGADYAPFVLLGDPAASIQPPKTVVSSPVTGPPYELRLEAMDDARRAVTNLMFLVRRLRPRNGDRQAWSQLIKNAESCEGQLQNSASRLDQSLSIAQRHDSLQRSIALACDLNLDRWCDRLRQHWQAHVGYYYSLSGRVEDCAVPVKTMPSSLACPSCASALFLREIELATTRAGSTRRMQYLCPKCLVVRDVPASATSQYLFHRVTHDSDRQMIVDVSWTNLTRRPQYCFAVAWPIDPNNVSAEASRKTHSHLISDVRCASSLTTPYNQDPDRGFELQPGATARWRYAVELSRPLFYLLHEVHLFVDFAWHWLASTHRGPQLGEWLRSRQYVDSLGELAGGQEELE